MSDGRRLTGLAIALSCASSICSACSNGTSGKDAGIDAGPGCSSNTDCDGGQVCASVDGGRPECEGCTTNGQCLPQQSCSPGQQVCVYLPGWGDQCVLNANCALGQFCVQGLCVGQSQVTFCTNDNCPTGLRCNTANLVCEQNLGCLSNSDCPTDESCNMGTRDCQPTCTAATIAQICQPTQQCVNSICVDCTSDANCGPGITCNVAEGKCEGAGTCFTNGDCPAGQVCDLATNSCGSTPPPCLSDDDCASTQVCDATTGSCVSATCQTDVFYPNVSQGEAAPIQAGESYTGLSLCNGADAGTQQSWFSISLQSGDIIQVTIEADVTGCGYTFDVELQQGDGTILANGNLVIDQTVPADGTYYLVMSDGDPSCSYGFSTLVSHGAPCPANPYAPNGDAAQAAPLDGGVDIGPIWLCAGEQDWYLTALPTAPTGQGLTVTLGCDPTQGPLTLTLYDSDGTTQLAQNDEGVATETATATASSGGRVFVVVTGDGRDSNAYTLSLSSGDGG
jgi:Cys-rich repeat protein